MTFQKFQSIVKERRPEIIVYQHGDNNIVNVQFSPNGRVYTYNGSYKDVLNRLGIKAVYQCEVNAIKHQLDEAILMNKGGYDTFFGKTKAGEFQYVVDQYQTELENLKDALIIDKE